MKLCSLLSLALVMTVPALFAQNNGDTAVTKNRAITLRMDWTRGDDHYGKNFVELHRPCEEKPCECVADFKVTASKENAKEFADYISSFEHGSVPVVYRVALDVDGHILGARLERVGDWTSEKLNANEGLLSVRVTVKNRTAQNRSSPEVNSPADCFRFR